MTCLRILALSVLLVLFTPAAARAVQEGPQDVPNVDEPLRVVVKNFEPFVMRQNEEIVGFSIDLWREIARRLELPYELREVTSVSEQLEAVQTERADIAIAGISITSERETDVDFSHSFFNAGLQILTRAERNLGLLNLLRVAFSPALLQIIGVFAIVIIVAAHIVWLLERRRNPDFPRGYLPGIWESIWWASVTVTTVGYGDRTPRTVTGRLIGLVWMFMGLFLIANFTANVTTTLTLDGLRSNISSVEDLDGHHVATLAGSTAAEYLRARGLSPSAIEVETAEEAYALLDEGTVEAVVYDAPVLRYFVATTDSNRYRIAGPIFNREEYGIAFPEGSPYVEAVDRTLLQIMEDGTYGDLYLRWFGEVLN